MNNRELFVDGYLERIGAQLNISKDDAFEVFSIAAVLDRSFYDIYNEVVVQGSKDGGIDGVYFQQQDDFYIMHVFQCKNSRSLKPNQIDKFRNDYNDVFTHGNSVNRPNLEDLTSKIEEYQQLTNQGVIIEPRLYFLYNGQNEDPQYAYNGQAYRNYHDPVTNFEIWDADALYNKISILAKAQSKRNQIKFTFRPTSSNISLADPQAIYSYSLLNVRAVNFRIPAVDLCQLIKDEKTANAHYDFLFSDNIRGYLGMRARANKRMATTIDDPNESIYFPFLNNGITIICDKLTIPSKPQNLQYLIPTVNPVIVNGLQTTRVLYEKYKEDPRKLENIYLNVRLYETDDEEIVSKITDATNTQTPINFRDKISNKDFNFWAKELFKNKNIAYLTKRGETFSNTVSRQGGASIDSDTVLKFWYATFYERPEIAKNSIRRVLEAVFEASTSEHPLSKLFDGNKDSPVYKQLLTAYHIYQVVQAQKREQKEFYDFIPHADELMSYGIYKERQEQTDHSTATLLTSYGIALQAINQIVTAEKTIYQNANKTFSLPSYFKKPKCRIDYNRVRGIIEQDNIILSLIE